MFLSVLLGIAACATLAKSFDMQPSESNCRENNTTCGDITSCCPFGFDCNYNRGIPQCQNPSDLIVSGFTGIPCTDPNLNDCSPAGIAGLCCPIGTVCFNSLMLGGLSCIDAYGVHLDPYESTSSLGDINSVERIANNNPNIEYDPEDAWKARENEVTCSSGDSVLSTTRINSTISFRYTGRSVRVNTVASPAGGVFSVWIDGFDTKTPIDTFSNAGLQCYPVQFPPFNVPPVSYASTDQHNITLIFVGSSPNRPNSTTQASILFDSFSIPDVVTNAVERGRVLRMPLMMAVVLIGFFL